MKHLTLALTLGFSLFAVAARADVNLSTCNNAVDHLSQVRDVNLLLNCADWFFHNDGEDRPSGSFNNIIALYGRALELDPRQPTVYTGGAWLLWSKWATWHRSPADMPDGEFKVEEALQWIARGDQYYKTNPDYDLDAGMTMWGLAQYYRPEVWPVVQQHHVWMDQYATTVAQHVRARINLGHIARQQGDFETAVVRYRSALEIDPTNQIAKNQLTFYCPKVPTSPACAGY